MTSPGPDREVDQIELELFVGSTRADSDARRPRDLAYLTAALFGSTDDATDAEPHEPANE